jgi:transposase InsO family protein
VAPPGVSTLLEKEVAGRATESSCRGPTAHCVSERTVSQYVERIRPEPRRTGSQTWSTFLRNQAKGIVAVDLFTVPTIRFQILYVFVVLALERRRLVFRNVTTNPTALCLSQQAVNAFPWDTAPRFMIRDRDQAYGNEFSRRVRNLGIRAIKTAIRAPKMNCYAERLIGTIRRELFDHVIVSSERHARRLLWEFQVWYKRHRLHLALEKDAPDHRPVEPPEMGEVVSEPRLGGLITGTPATQPEATACRRWHDSGSAMPSDSVPIPTVGFSFTKTMESRRSQSLQSSSLTRLISLVEAGSVPTLAEAAVLAIHRTGYGRSVSHRGASGIPRKFKKTRNLWSPRDA